MRLLLIAPEAYPVPSPQGTSVETSIYSIASNLARAHSVTVVSRSTERFRQSSTREHLRIVRVPGGSRHRYIKGVVRAVAGQSFHHIQVNNRPSFLPIIRKRFPQTPLSIFLHSITFVTPPKTSLRKCRSQLECADLIICNSESLRTRLSELYPSVASRVKIVYLGVSSSTFRPSTPRERALARTKYGVRNAFVVLYVGRLIPIKGITVLIKALKLVREKKPNTKLLVVGSGKRSYVCHLRSLARRLGVPTLFTGVVPRRSLPQLYWAGDCFVCPSQGHEAFGLVVVEALSSGLPVVASANGGITEIVAHNQTGLLVEDYGNPIRFSESILAIATHEALAQNLGKQGRAVVLARFSWRRSSECLQQLSLEVHNYGRIHAKDMGNEFGVLS